MTAIAANCNNLEKKSLFYSPLVAKQNIFHSPTTGYRAIDTGNPKIFRVASLFAGCGGFDLGFSGGFDHLGVNYEKLPYKLVWANDIDPDAQSAYIANQDKYLGNHSFVLGDIKNQKTEDIPDFDILLAGFPCQPFSNAGNRKGVKDERGSLFEEVERFVKAKKPIAFVLENVKGILSSKMPDGTPIPLEIRNRLHTVKCDDGEILTYNIAVEKLLKTEHYGVPQQRHRVIIIGIKQDKNQDICFDFELLQNNVKKESLALTKVKHILENIPPNSPYVDDHWHLSPQAAGMVPMITRSWKDIPYDLLPTRLKKIRDQMKKYHSPNFYRRFGLEEINGTITASAQPENCGILHPHKNRRYTVREIARIQSFPDDYLFTCKSIEGKYKVIGNAVPPVFAFVIAKTLYDHLSNSINISQSKFISKQLTLSI
jgi:DNA (cytosine-5)-methyltransferase 1